jgi:hypothetical protein
VDLQRLGGDACRLLAVQLNNQFLIYYNSSKPPVQEAGKPLPVPAGAINLEHVRT